MLIYFDNAATTMKKPEEVAQAVCLALSSFGGVGRGVHPASLAAGRAVFEARERIAALLDVSSPNGVAFALNATMALNIALQGLAKPGSKIVSTAASHNSVLRPLFRLRDELHCEIEIIPIQQDGSLDYALYEQALSSGDVSLVAVTHASNVTGDIYDAKRMAQAAHAAGALFVLDAAQTAGSYPVSMRDIGADVLCFTGHKGLFGPQGTGGICLRKGTTIRPLKVGGSGIHSFDKEQPQFMPELLEAGTINAHGIAGLNASLKYLKKEGLEKLYTKEALLTKTFYEGVRRIEGVRVYGNFDQEKRAPVVSLNIWDEDAGKVSEILWEDYGIATRAGAHCAPLMHEALGTTEQGVVRFSFSSFNTIEEIKQGIEAIRELASE